MKADAIKLMLSGALLALAGSVHAAGGGLGCGGGGCPGGGSGGQGAGLPSGNGDTSGASTEGPRIHAAPNGQSDGTVSKGGAGSGTSRDTGGTGVPGAQSGKPSPATKHDAGGSQGW
ncbi:MULTISPECIES: hypothetical protein [unclassified Caballeronia]|uniref:hypothetical protein n=1 Tax=unclassified Caballeronia TaxID=2646786 RepID=UPI002865918D|nr:MULTISPECIES: hypothetical protein [unclassified Caballeronia]MDR5741318.1 hypothetical protein [Caballeronia sp. LZ016]MDR5807215.1 hypothetical protein [Caballeronia sp. LZ019]